MRVNLDTSQVEALIRKKETLRTEFKGEDKQSLPDRDIYEVVVCLANTEGGTLLIGVEDNGKFTGARPRHRGSTDPVRLMQEKL